MLALLPMKKNSERVPNKNLRLLNEKPLYEYILDTLRDSKLFEFTVINTDSQEISETAKYKYGNFVKIVDRPQELCGDDVSMNKIIEHDISIFGQNKEYFQTHSTNPFLSKGTISDAIEAFKNGFAASELDSLFSVNQLQCRLYKQDLTPINHDPNTLIKTQDLQIVYEENSCFYIFTGKSFQTRINRIGSKPYIFKMSRSAKESIEIDTMDDWNLVKLLVEKNEND